MNEFATFLYSVPYSLMSKLETGFKGYTIKSVLDRKDAVGSTLTLKDGEDADTVILTEKVRNAPSN